EDSLRQPRRMLPVSTDTLAWIATELALAVLEDGEDGRPCVLAGEPIEAEDLASAAAVVAGRPGADPEVRALVDEARRGVRGALEVGSGRLVAWGAGPGRAAVIFAPRAEAIARK